VRIIAGSLKGREITLPRNSRIRPATGFVRELVMNLLFAAAGGDGGLLSGGQFLDVCAGSGLMGFEALSRGAARAIFIEADYRTAQQLHDNAAHFGVEGQSIILRCDARRCFPVVAKKLDGTRLSAAFLDPPFIRNMAESILLRLAEASALFSPQALIIVRTPDELPVALDGLRFIERRLAGQAALWLYAPDPPS
jgi:16S rRNA (guanine966-N2)-methyltransferase